MKKFAPLILFAFLPLLIGIVISDEKPVEALDDTGPALVDGTYTVDTQASTLYWEAFMPGGSHLGGISLERGELVVKDGLPRQGSFVVDMNSITNMDIDNPAFRMNLVNHIKSDDFFSVADYPTALFDVTGAHPYEGDGNFNYEIEGDLSLRGVTKPITLLANIHTAENRLTTFARSEIDRTQFGITTRSGSFFEDLGDKLVEDVFVVEMDLVADRVEEGL